MERAARATEKGWSMFLRQFIRAQVWKATLRDRLLEARGATAVEYALMLALIAMVIFAVGGVPRDADEGQFEQGRLHPAVAHLLGRGSRVSTRDIG